MQIKSLNNYYDKKIKLALSRKKLFYKYLFQEKFILQTLS